MRNLHFKYQVGDLVTHVGFLKPMRQPVIQQFQIVSRTLVEGPGCIHRFYYVCPTEAKAHLPMMNRDALRVHEDHLAPLPGDEP
jgi:hypothetical protein